MAQGTHMKNKDPLTFKRTCKEGRFTDCGLWAITKIQQSLSVLLAIQMVLMIVIWAVVVMVQYDSLADALMIIAAGLVLAIQLSATIVFIKNIRRPNTFTLVMEWLMMILIWVHVSFGAYLVSLYLNQENSMELLIEHANRAVTTDYQATLITGFKLGQQGLLIITFFYILQVLIQRRQRQQYQTKYNR
jgi:hypothetical protein